METSEELKEEIKEKLNSNIVEQAVLTNATEFEVQGKFYRVIRPTTNQKQEAYQQKIMRYMSLMKEKDEKGDYIYFPEKQLRKIYKERGLDIDEFDNTIKTLELKRKDYQEKLGKGLTENLTDAELQIFKTEIESLNQLINEAFQAKSSLLEPSLENQSMSYLYEYLTFLITEVKNEKGEYEKAFKTFADFRNADNAVTNVIGLYSGMLLGSL